MSYFLAIPDDIIFNLALDSSLEDIYNLCRIESRFKHIICDNEVFWRSKYVREYGYSNVGEIIGWKKLYMNYGKVIVYGNLSDKLLGLRLIDDDLSLKNIRAKEVSCGSEHVAIVDLSDNVWMFGGGRFGQLGLGYDEYDTISPEKINNIKSKKVSCGSYHTAIIDIEGTVYTFGYNSRGQLGHGDTIDKNIPVPILMYNLNGIATSNVNIVDVSCGMYTTALIDDNGNLFMCGVDLIFTPAKVGNFKAKQVSSGDYHTGIIDTNNNVWMIGNNENGQLGLGDFAKRLEPTIIPNIKAKKISCGGDNTMIIDMEDNVLSFGGGQMGSLGLLGSTRVNVPTMINIYEDSEGNDIGIKVLDVICGWNTSIIIDIDHNMYYAGRHIGGILGSDTTYSFYNVPRQVASVKAVTASIGKHNLAIVLSSQEKEILG